MPRPDRIAGSTITNYTLTTTCPWAIVMLLSSKKGNTPLLESVEI